MGIATVVLLALGGLATGASAAKPVLWLKQFTMERAAPGTPAYAAIDLGDGCSSSQGATLAGNGRPSDEVTVTPTTAIEECEGGKLASSISSVVLKAVGSEEVTITAKSVVHVLADPWCVYALPKTISLTASAVTAAEGTVTGALDKPASFGSCPSSRTMNVTVRVDEAFSAAPFFTENVS
ncbi:MAG TPA: hypothetical protein VHW67_07115 [Solirubrobacteraceae bacterium]|nr:hypothetical protein [Solirubrobacteraceae bacterium]